MEQTELQLSVASIDAATRRLSSQYQASRRLTLNPTLTLMTLALTLNSHSNPNP